MADNKSFVPSVEPPPHPTDINSPSSPHFQVHEVMDNPTPVTPPPSNTINSNNPTGNSNEFNFPPKKGFPKVLKFVLIGLAGVILILALLLIFKSKGSTTLVGTKGDITWWGINEEEQVVMPLIEEFQSKNPNVRIRYVKQSKEDYRERLTNALASGQGPDIFEIHNSWGSMFKNEVSIAPSNIFSKQEFDNIFYPTASIDLTNPSGVFAVPLEHDALTLFINKDIFTSALKAPPKTWIELTDLAKENELTLRAANRLIAQSGVALGLTENVDYWPEIFALMLLQNGANLQKPGEDITRDAASFYTNFNKTIKSWDSTMPVSTSAFARGKLAMYFGTTKSIPALLKENPNLRFSTVPLPQLPKEKPTDPDISYATYWAHGVWKRSSNTEVSWAFLKFLSSREGLQSLNTNRRNLNIAEKVYPREDMAVLQREDEVLGSIVTLAPAAMSWYLADMTFDGPTGINSQINKAYEDVLITVLDNQDILKAVRALPDNINGIITKFTSSKK